MGRKKDTRAIAKSPDSTCEHRQLAEMPNTGRDWKCCEGLTELVWLAVLWAGGLREQRLNIRAQGCDNNIYMEDLAGESFSHTWEVSARSEQLESGTSPVLLLVPFPFHQFVPQETSN